MLESAWLFVGRIAFAWTVLTLIGAVYIGDPSQPGEGLATIAGVVGFVLWGVWTFGTLQIQVVDNGTEFVFTHPELTILGIAMALVPGYIALEGPIELVSRARNPRMEEL